MLDKIFVSPQVKRIVIITNKHGIYGMSHELPKDLKLRTLTEVAEGLKTLTPRHFRRQGGLCAHTRKKKKKKLRTLGN